MILDVFALMLTLAAARWLWRRAPPGALRALATSPRGWMLAALAVVWVSLWIWARYWKQ